jgi:hypothetical protein
MNQQGSVDMTTTKLGKYISQKLSGQPTEPVPSTSLNRPTGTPSPLGAAARSAVAGQAPVAPDDIDQQEPAEDTTDTGTAEDEARSKLDQDVLAAIDDETDPGHAAAVRLLKAYTQLVEIERRQP